MNNLQFYYVNQDYINYLRKFDKKIALKNRPYIGINLNQEFLFLAPLYSPKEKHKKYYMNNTFFRIYDFEDQYIGIIKFSNMIPVLKKFVTKINFNCSNKLYQEQYYILKHQKQVIKKAMYTYCNYSEHKDLCVNFKKMENIIKNTAHFSAVK